MFVVIADYQALFADPEVRMLPLTAGVCLRAAQIRAASQFSLKVPDCLHLATAIEHGCALFLTNDAHLSRCTQVPVEILQ
jgi:predicted nucleic acid-binding protein